MSNSAQRMASVVVRTEVALERASPAEVVSPQYLHAAMRYATLGAGERVRPLLTHAAGTLSGTSPEAPDGVSCAVEVVHTYSFIHDDIPCMDGSDLCRGRSTVCRTYDETTTLLIGDTLQTQALIMLAEQGAVCPATRAMLMGELARTSGSQGMAGDQAINLQNVGIALSQDGLEAMHRMKTGALLRASPWMGAFYAEMNAAALEHVNACAGAVGLAFQMVDDILDVTVDVATLGRTTGKDEANDKPTYVSILGPDKARALTDELHVTAGAAVAELTREIGCKVG